MRLGVIPMAVAALAMPALLEAQSFEGRIRQRQIVVSMEALYPVLNLDEGAEPAEIAARTFDIPLADLLALTGESEEGTVEISELTFYVGKNKMRVDTEAALMPGYMVMDFESGALRMVMPVQKMYLEITGEDVRRLQDRFGEQLDGGEAQEAEIIPLGRTREINGMNCEAYEIRRGTTISRTWVSAELRDVVTAFVGFMERMEAFGMAEEDGEDLQVFVLMQEHGFPVLEQTLYDYGWDRQYEISEVVSVDREPVAEDRFSIPADYARKSFMEMLELLGGEGN